MQWKVISVPWIRFNSEIWVATFISWWHQQLNFGTILLSLWLVNQLDLNPFKFDFLKGKNQNDPMKKIRMFFSVNYIQIMFQFWRYCRRCKSDSAYHTVGVWRWVAVILAALTLICLPCAKTVYHKHNLSNSYIWFFILMAIKFKK